MSSSHTGRMRFTVLAAAILAGSCSAAPAPPPEPAARWGIAIHSGSGTFTLATLADRREPIRTAMTEALAAGHRVLAAGGSSLDAVEAAIRLMEDSPLFNAGRGAVFTHDGVNELDASIMDGASRRAGAVAGVKQIKNPIALARLVMDKSVHVMMAGAGAEAFAVSQGVELVDPSYFRTDRAWDTLQRELEAERQQSSAAPAGYFGTVGAVALDRQGNLAAGTSTGGMSNKRYGRVGDSPIIGAGTYASNDSCGISSTGHGEYFIRYSVAHDVCARVAYGGVSLQQAADEVVQNVLRKAGGEGGVIGMDRLGRVAFSFNVTGMGRGYAGPDGRPVVMLTNEDAMAIP
jgi:L-asparaginase / beta-aspartyl-peptidase